MGEEFGVQMVTERVVEVEGVGYVGKWELWLGDRSFIFVVMRMYVLSDGL